MSDTAPAVEHEHGGQKWEKLVQHRIAFSNELTPDLLLPQARILFGDLILGSIAKKLRGFAPRTFLRSKLRPSVAALFKEPRTTNTQH